MYHEEKDGMGTIQIRHNDLRKNTLRMFGMREEVKVIRKGPHLKNRRGIGRQTGELFQGL